jgi:4-hydroxy-2-oxoglutarate aldolase
MKLQGIFPALTTPFDFAGDLYEIKVRHNVEKYNLTSVSGYVVCGSTGESVFLTSEEKLRVCKWVAESNTLGKALIAGTGAESVRETVELSNCAADLGYAAALVRTPHYYKSMMNRPESQEIFFRTVADQSRIPVLIYNFPQLTGVDIGVASIAALSHHPNIIGMKDSSGNVERVARIVREAKPGFQVLVGSATTLAASLAAGASGGVLAMADAVPYATIAIWEAYRTRETAAVEDWQQRVACAAQVISTKHGIPGLKYAMDLNGYYGGPPRLPLVAPGPEARLEIEKAFEGIKG